MGWCSLGKSKVILPKKLSVDPKKMAQAITNTLNSTALAIKADFAVTVQTWQDKATFVILSPSPWSRTIGTDDAIYGMLNEGTRAHDIVPKPGKVLAFRTPFRSKTLPRQIASRAGSKGTNQVFSPNGVHHPGTAAREWDTTIAQKWDTRVGAIFQRAIDAAVD